ncbi:MAG TPA: histidinol phosphatase [Thermoanaerobaculia bacterium]|nr:histidinol phosphatase [Thermoanaerobaculia bacterium]
MNRLAGIVALAVALAAAVVPHGAPAQTGSGGPPGRRFSTVERLSDQRLAATHSSGDDLRENVSRPAPLSGLTDYRAIFHAHASDSDHTGGTLDEILDDAHRARVEIVFLSDHPSSARDFVNGWRGVREGVLFIPGAETKNGYLLQPTHSVRSLLDGPVPEMLAATMADGGLAFLSHLEDHDPVSFDGVTGTEIYNRHADAKDDAASMAELAQWMTDPAGVVRLRNAISRHPVEVYAAQQDYPAEYLTAWDRATAAGQRLVGVAANDCHHNQVFVVKKIDEASVRLGTVVDADDEMTVFTTATRPRLPEMVANRDAGEVVARFDFDPYWVSMRFVSTHILARALDEASVREAVRAGHVYVSHDWIADPTGFRFYLAGDGGEPAQLMGDQVPWRQGARIVTELSLPAQVRLLRDGVEVATAPPTPTEDGPAPRTNRFEHVADAPGVYRIEAWVEIGGELRPWIYSNPIYLRGEANTGAE